MYAHKDDSYLWADALANLVKVAYKSERDVILDVFDPVELSLTRQPQALAIDRIKPLHSLSSTDSTISNRLCTYIVAPSPRDRKFEGDGYLRPKVRRSLQRQWKRSLAGVALLLALGQAPAHAATINVGGACTLVRAIVAATRRILALPHV